MGDEALEAITSAYFGGFYILNNFSFKLTFGSSFAVVEIIGPRKYTLSHFLRFQDELEAKAKWLQKVEKEEKQSYQPPIEWNAQLVQLCLYVDAHLTEDKQETTSAATDEKKPAKKKRRTR
jgi:hypothetical protein